MRCFVACFLEAASVRALERARPVINGCLPVPVENLHVTLHFLGSVAGERRDEVLALTATLDSVATTATVVALTGFPSSDHARAVVARLQVDDRLLRWHDELVRAWPTDDGARPFKPHVTLARARRPVAVPAGDTLQGMNLNLRPPAAYLSDTRADGPRYEPLPG